ncbi:MAG: M13 family metallopeptidase [Actinobacteria bacterium]|nr:M13 family metallopeptidase [Actinomycetota bacterium]
MTLSPADRDHSVHPGVDFYRYANGGWIDANPIPSGYGAWGAIEELDRRNDLTVRRLLEQAAAQPDNDLDRMLGDYFASGMDTAAIEEAGISAIEPSLRLIDGIATHADVWALLPEFQRNGFMVFFGWAVTVDHDDASSYLLWLAQTGLGLPDRDAYFSAGEAPEQLRAAYVEHVARQLRNLGTDADEAAELATHVLEFETRMADLHLRGEERRDPSNTLNRHDLDALQALAPALQLPAFLSAIGAGSVTTVNVQNPRLIAGIHGVVAATDIATIRAYLRFQVVHSLASALPAAFEDANFEFYGRRVGGQQEPHERAKRIIGAIGGDMGEAVGQRFVEATFPPTAKERALVMVQAIVDEMRRSLETRTWMSDETRARGLTKLDAIGVKIGYPDVWRDWSGLQIDRTHYAQNRLNAERFELDRQLSLLTQPVDPTEWEMPPHVVNAYYHPIRNEIVFPAGILQPPMFDAEADDAVNFGGIGTVIAHEITHGFDDSGRRFDADGAFRDWWTPDDEARFAALTERLVAQYDEYVAIDEVHVNGRLTLGENIADLGGIALAARALERVSGDAPPVDGMTPLQRFYLANASIWRANTSDELARTLAQVDTHSPRHLRVLGPMSNQLSFQRAFDLADDAPMMRPPEERIEIW